MNYKKDTIKGHYKLLYPHKYLGTKLPIYKSRWEKKVFYAMDKNPFILKWGYECIEIYYHHPIFNNFTVYYPDIFCHVKNEMGREEQMLIEIKPAKMCIAPKRPNPPKNKTTKSWARYQKSMISYKSALRDFAVNTAKWEAAQVWCAKRGVTWHKLHENNTTNLFTSPNVKI